MIVRDGGRDLHHLVCRCGPAKRQCARRGSSRAEQLQEIATIHIAFAFLLVDIGFSCDAAARNADGDGLRPLQLALRRMIAPARELHQD